MKLRHSLINPQQPAKGRAWYVWEERWSGWKKTLLSTYLGRTDLTETERKWIQDQISKKGINEKGKDC